MKSVFGSPFPNTPTIDRSGMVSFPPETNDPFQDFSPDGSTESILAALPGENGDPHLDRLKGSLFESNKVLGNVILVARREFCRGYDGRWSEYPNIPRSCYLKGLIDEVARSMDITASSHIVRGFLRYQQSFVKKQLEKLLEENLELEQQSPELRDSLLPELLCYMINHLPYDDRPDLVEVEDRVEYDESDILQGFVVEQRQKLGEFMGSNVVEYEDLQEVDDGNGVDMGFALGFGEKQCVQADFLIPALLGMAKEIDVSLVVLPEGSLVNHPLLFGSDQIAQLLRRLPYFAELYGLDKDIAAAIYEQYESIIGTAGSSVEHDLRRISFIASVSRTITS